MKMSIKNKVRKYAGLILVSGTIIMAAAGYGITAGVMEVMGFFSYNTSFIAAGAAGLTGIVTYLLICLWQVKNL